MKDEARMVRVKSVSLSFFALGLGWFCLVGLDVSHAAVAPSVQSQKGMIAADHVLASAAGIEILRQGGNAVDAACAAAFAQSVVSPAGSGIGGGGFMLIKKAKDPLPIVIDFRETAPAGSRRDMFLKPGLAKDASRKGGLAVGVPGEVRGCAVAVYRYGKLDLKKVLQPAIRYAQKGFPIGSHLAHSLKRYASKLKSHPTIGPIFYPNGKALALGQTLKRPILAKTLKAIAAHGSDVFYLGWIAKDIVEAVRKAGGIMTLKDLANYRVKERKALVTDYHGYQVYGMPPPSSGGVAMIQALNILRKKELKSLGHNSSPYLHFLSESFQHAFADRARYLGDTDFVKVPVERLTSQAYADQLVKRIKDKVSSKESYGTKKKPAKAGHRDGGTSHISVIDKDGVVVSMTTTINTGFGAKLMATRSGIILNNEMDDFSTKPGKPNVFGLIQSENNEIQAGKRPLSSMSPTIVVKDGKPVLALGASGGPTIITGTLQVLINVLDFQFDLRDAVSRGRIHHQWSPSLLFIEPDLSVDVRTNLLKRGHKLKVFHHPFTAVQAVLLRQGVLFGASDPRKAGVPIGY